MGSNNRRTLTPFPLSKSPCVMFRSSKATFSLSKWVRWKTTVGPWTEGPHLNASKPLQKGKYILGTPTLTFQLHLMTLGPALSVIVLCQ